MGDQAAFEQIIASLPTGHSVIEVHAKSYRVTKLQSANGNTISVEAEGRSKDDYISFNYYPVLEKDKIKPCEMPIEKVQSFLKQISVSQQ